MCNGVKTKNIGILGENKIRKQMITVEEIHIASHFWWTEIVQKKYLALKIFLAQLLVGVQRHAKLTNDREKQAFSVYKCLIDSERMNSCDIFFQEEFRM